MAKPPETNGFARRQRVLRRRRREHNNTGSPIGSFWFRAVLALGVLSVAAAGGLVVAGIQGYNSYADELVPPDELAINQPSYGAKILDRNGNLLYEYVDDQAGLRRPIPIDEVSSAFLAATIATEDNTFFTNPGINWKGIARAAWENSPFGGTVFEGSGGSSITQQLVKNVYISQEARQERWSREGVDRKVKEMIYALELTERYPKEKILEWYVNQISYGGVYNGIEAASEGYFGKSSSELTLSQAALIAGIPQSPAAYDPATHPEAARERRDEILDLMYRQGRIQIGENTFFELTEADVAAAKAEPIEIVQKRFPIEAPHFVLQYIQPQLEQLFSRDALFRDGLVVTTTLDLGMQVETQEIMEQWITEFEDISNSHNGSMMVMDPKTGEILVMLGSRDYFREDIEGKNNNATACNSPGSSFKPFVYMTTFKELNWGPGTTILDTPVKYPDGAGGVFEPSNPTHDFSGPVSIRFALGNSLNVPPVKAAAEVGPQTIVVDARQWGFVDTFRLDGCAAGGYGPAIATGGIDVTLEEMMMGYSVLANDGVMRGQEPVEPHDSDERQMDPVSILKITNADGDVLWDIDNKRREEQVIDPAYPYMIWSILTDPNAQCKTFGCGGITIPGYTAGVKTGTSEPFNEGDVCAGKIGETWAFGFSPDLVVGIWAGNSNNDCIDHIYSTSISFRAMRDTFIMAHEDITVTAYPRPDNVVEAEVCRPSGLKPTDLCQIIEKDLFAKDKVPEEEDTWWQKVAVDRRNGLLATATTPGQYIETKVMLVLPEELIDTPEKLEQEQKKAEELGYELAPTEKSDGSIVIKPGDDDNGGSGGNIFDQPIAITYPGSGQSISGVVQIAGSATSDDFESYVVEFGRGVAPTSWTQINSSNQEVEAGILGLWNTTGLEYGTYSIRLRVKDSEKGEASYRVIVNVGAITGPSLP